MINHDETRPWIIKPNRPSYIELIEADWPDFAAIKAFEEDIAAGIVQYVMSQRTMASGSLYILISNLLDDDKRKEVRRLVWNRIAPSWMNVYDCSGPEDDLWVAAMYRAYYKLFQDTFEFPSERNGVSGRGLRK